MITDGDKGVLDEMNTDAMPDELEIAEDEIKYLKSTIEDQEKTIRECVSIIESDIRKHESAIDGLKERVKALTYSMDDSEHNHAGTMNGSTAETKDSTCST